MPSWCLTKWLAHAGKVAPTRRSRCVVSILAGLLCPLHSGAGGRSYCVMWRTGLHQLRPVRTGGGCPARLSQLPLVGILSRPVGGLEHLSRRIHAASHHLHLSGRSFDLHVFRRPVLCRLANHRRVHCAPRIPKDYDPVEPVSPWLGSPHNIHQRPGTHSSADCVWLRNGPIVGHCRRRRGLGEKDNGILEYRFGSSASESLEIYSRPLGSRCSQLPLLLWYQQGVVRTELLIKKLRHSSFGNLRNQPATVTSDLL